MVQVVSILENTDGGISPVRGGVPNQQATGADAGGQIGQALQGFGQQLGQLAVTVAQEQARRQSFTEEASFIDFQAAQQGAFVEASRSASGSNALGFTATRMQDLDAAFAEWSKANPTANPEARQAQYRAFRARMGQQALTTELETTDKFYATQIGDKLDLFSKGILQSPGDAETYIQQGDAFIDASGLPQGVKDQLKRGWRESAAAAKANALLSTDPEALNKALTGGYGPGVTPTAAGAMDALQTAWGSKLNITSTFRSPERNAAVGGAKNSQHMHGAAFDVDVSNMSLEERKRLIVEARRAGFSGIGVYANSLHFDVGGDRAWGPNYSRNSLPAWAADAVTAPLGQARAAEPDPVLASLSYADTLKFADAATTSVAALERESALAAQADYDSRLNTLLNGLNDGTMGAGAIEAARAEGWLTDYDDINKAQGVLGTATEKQTNLAAGLAALQDPNTVWNPFDKDQKKQMDEVVAASDSPVDTGYRIWNKTGILPEPSVAALRGGLVSTDPTKVLGAARIAGNMIAANPNAFASVGDGKADLEAAGIEFNRQVNQLGRTPQEAAEILARENDPTFKATAPAREDVQAFEQALRKDGVSATILDGFDPGALSSEPAGPLTVEQQAVMDSDYIAFATENFRMYGDEGRAKEYATAQMNKLYGVSNGRVTKYPPEKIYPPIGETGHAYIYDQAVTDIKSATGRDVLPENVYLVPQLRGATAEAWRQGQLPPYQLTYLYEDPETGQMLFDTVPGKMFVADPKAPMAAETARRQTEFNAAREEAAYAAWAEQKNRYDIQQEAIAKGLWNVAPADIIPDPGPAPTAPPSVLREQRQEGPQPETLPPEPGTFTDPLTGIAP